MKRNGLAVLTLLALAGAAVAAPRESTSFPAAVVSASNGTGAGRTQADGTVTLNQTFTGGYSAVRIAISGSVENTDNLFTYASEARIYVTPPAPAAPFTVQPFTSANYTGVLPVPAGATVTLAGGGFDPVGNWTYVFFESYQDGTSGEVNSTWQNLVMTFDDAAPPPPTAPTADVTFNLSPNPDFVTQQVISTQPNEVRWVKVILPQNVTPANGRFLDIDTEGSSLTGDPTFINDTYIALFNAGGTLVKFDDDDGSGALSQLSFGSGIRPGAPAADYNGRDGSIDAGTYFLACFGYAANTFPSPFIVNGGPGSGTFNVNVRYNEMAPPAPPTTFFSMGAIPTDGNFVTHTFGLDPATVKWAKITIGDVAAASNTFLDIDTETSSALATAICMFKPDGTIAGQDTLDGSGNLSQLTFGAGTRAGVLNGNLYNGRDGATLAAGEYFVAVALPPAAFSAGWQAASTSGDLGDVVLRIRSGTQPAPTPPVTFTDLGALTAGTHVSTADIGAGEVKWFRFSIATDASNATTTFLDIDTEGSTIADTYMSLFDNAGAVRIGDDDDGSGFLSQFTFGQSFPARPAVGDGEVYDGFDGVLAAGTYWLAAYGYPNSVGSPAAGWIVGSTSAQAGSITVNFNFGTAQFPAGTFVKTVDGGETPDTAIVASGTGNLNAIAGTMTANHTDLFRIAICDFANFSASTVGGTTFDTQLFLFKSGGEGVTFCDDNVGGIAGQSTITSINVTHNGVYVLAISQYNRDPIDADGALMWNDQPFEGERAPDGPGSLNAVASWTGGTTSVAGYMISLTGACFIPTGPTPCNAADVAGLGGSVGPDHFLTPDDIIVYLNAFFTANLAVADIAVLGGNPGSDGMITPDDLIFFLSQFFQPCNP